MHCIIYILFYALCVMPCILCIEFMHCIICIVFYVLYYMYCILFIELYVLYSMHCVLWIVFYAIDVFYALCSMNCILCIYVFYALWSMNCFLCILFILCIVQLYWRSITNFETRWSPTDRQTDRRTDIVLHRAAIAAKKQGRGGLPPICFVSENPMQNLRTLGQPFLGERYLG